MRRFLVLVTALALALTVHLTVPRVAVACSCVAPDMVLTMAAEDPSTVVFTGEVTIASDGQNRFVILPDETQAPAGSVDLFPSKPGSGNMSEDTGYLCEGPAPCPITDGSTGLSFMLPAGWWTDHPTTEGYTSGAQAAGDVFPPRVNFFRTGTNDALVLGPRQWVAMNGPCEEVDALGQFCMFESTDPQVLAAMEAGDQEPQRQFIANMFLPTSDRRLMEDVLTMMLAVPSHVAVSAMRGGLAFDGPAVAA